MTCPDHPAIARAIATGDTDPEEYRAQVFVCSGCGDPIREGDPYVNLLGEQYCMDCIEELTNYAEFINGKD